MWNGLSALISTGGIKSELGKPVVTCENHLVHVHLNQIQPLSMENICGCSFAYYNCCMRYHFGPYGCITIYSPENMLLFELKVFKLTGWIFSCPQMMTGQKAIAYLLVSFGYSLHIYLAFCILSMFWNCKLLGRCVVLFLLCGVQH